MGLGLGMVSGGVPFINTNSMLFNGTTSHGLVPASSAFALGTSGAISVWAKWTAAMVNYQDLVSCFFPTGGAPGFSFWIVGRKPSLFISNGSSFDVATSTGSALSDETWYHLVATWSGATLKMYVDSAQHGADLTLTVGAADSGVDLRIGSDTNTVPSRFFPGYMTHHSIWNTYLDSSGVGLLRNSNKPANLLSHPSVSHLVSWWRLGDPPDSITSVPDRSGNAHTATPVDLVVSDVIP